MSIAAAYNCSPSVEEAESTFLERNAKSTLDNAIRSVFLKHGMAKKYGVSLVHQHFPIDEDERIVEVGRVSTPWKVGVSPDHSMPMYGGTIVPQNYKFHGRSLIPFEFAMVHGGAQDASAIDAAFAEEYRSVLEEHGLLNILGLAKRSDDDEDYPLEITQGVANIFMPSRSGVDSIDTFWAFDNDGAHVVRGCHKYPDGSHRAGPGKN